jgi:hypothetical protein
MARLRTSAVATDFPTMTSLKRELYDTFQSLINERDRLRLEVSQAQETVSLLETEISAINFHADAAFAKTVDEMEVKRLTFELVTDSIPGSHWLSDIWLSVPSNAALLGEAEAAWKENIMNPQKALNIVGKVTAETRKTSERMRCDLFRAAVMLASGHTEETCAIANAVLHQCGSKSKYRHLAGIAHYLRGRVFLEIQSYRQAYWDFSLAVFTPGYHERVKHFQRHTENCYLQEQNDEQARKTTAKATNGQRSTSDGSNRRPALKLGPSVQASVHEFKFEKARATRASSSEDL